MKGQKPVKFEQIQKVPAPVAKVARQSGMSPLDYLLTVMRDEGQDPQVRLRAAALAAPFVHAKPADTAKGKKEQAEDEAKTAGQGTEWGDDLAAPLN